MINIDIKPDKFWKQFKSDNLKLWVKGYIYSHSIENIISICKNLKKEEVPSFIAGINGHFALAVQRDKLTFLAVDKIRSTPLFFTKIKDNFFINSDPKNLINLNNFNKLIDENARLEIAMSGFVIGNKTIYNKLHSLKAGEIVMFHENSYE